MDSKQPEQNLEFDTRLTFKGFRLLQVCNKDLLLPARSSKSDCVAITF